MYGIYLIAIMVVTGGAIAFIGDKLGTKIGKKRLSIFGLRPRHTSMIITVITGSMITALTMGALAVTSENVRTALFGMEELNAAMSATKIQLDEVSNELFLAQEEYKKADESLSKSKEEIKTLKAEEEELIEESERLKAGNEQLEQEKSELTAQNENLSKENSELAEFNVTLTADNEKLTKDNSELEEHAKNLRDGLIAIREGSIAFRAGEILASGVIAANQTAEKIAEEINKLANDASENVAQRFGEDTDSSVWIYQPELNDAIEKISQSSQDMILRITAAGNLIRGEPIITSLSLYPNNPVFAKGELIITKSYDVNSYEDSQGIVQNFLSAVNQSAISRGILADPRSGTVGIIDSEQLYDIIDSVGNARGKIFLTAYARNNTTAIGPLRLNIKLEQKSGV